MAGTRDFLQYGSELAPVDSGLKALAAGLPSGDLVLPTVSTPTQSGTPSTEDSSREPQPAMTSPEQVIPTSTPPVTGPLDAIDALLADVNNPKPKPPKKEPTFIPVGPAAKAAAKQLIEPINNHHPLPRIPAVAVSVPAPVMVKHPKGTQAVEDLLTSATDRKVTARNLTLFVPMIAVVLVITRSLMNRILNTRPNEKTILNQTFDYTVPGLLAACLLLSYALVAASTRAKAQAAMKNAALFKQEQRDAKGKARADQPDEEQLGKIVHL